MKNEMIYTRHDKKLIDFLALSLRAYSNTSFTIKCDPQDNLTNIEFRFNKDYPPSTIKNDKIYIFLVSVVSDFIPLILDFLNFLKYDENRELIFSIHLNKKYFMNFLTQLNNLMS